MTPSRLWYANLGLGMVLLVALTTPVVLGILTSRRLAGVEWPRFVTAGLHRNISCHRLAQKVLVEDPLEVVNQAQRGQG